MDFEVISFHERFYKIVSMIAITLVSISLVLWCYLAKFDPSIVFFASALYALVLFLVGLYINNSNFKITYHFAERAEIYRRLKSSLSKMESMDKMPYHVNRITAFQDITGRSEEDQFIRKQYGDRYYFETLSKYKMPLCKGNEEKIYRLEKRFLDNNLELCKRIGGIILQCEKIDMSQIGKDFEENVDERGDYNNVLGIENAISFSINEWCSTNPNYSPITDDLEKHYSNHKDKPSIDADIEALKKLYTDIERLYLKYKKKAELNIQRLLRVYGNRIDLEAQQLQDASDRNWGVNQEIDETKQAIIDLLTEMFDFMKNIEERFSVIESTTEDLAYKCESIEDVLDSINNKIKHDERKA